MEFRAWGVGLLLDGGNVLDERVVCHAEGEGGAMWDTGNAEIGADGRLREDHKVRDVELRGNVDKVLELVGLALLLGSVRNVANPLTRRW